ncbi:diguanylate cyclase [Deinococcus sonorensis]|uniref:Diguanylate cyclase n=2 Tax=Deinococcus sonorensis TaxID=309891 RepID=A0AAU7U594_9DEIO
MARIRTQAQASGHTVLVVDDDPDLLSTISRLLQADGHQVLEAPSGAEAVRLCREHDVHLMLLDYFMPGMTGEEVVRQVRTFDPRVQIVLQTGYASEKPPRQMLRELDIQGYHDKSEGPDKLLVWVDAALKTFRHVRALHASRSGLEYILNAAPELHRLQPLEDLLRGILLQIQGILGFSGACVATHAPNGLVATPGDAEFMIRVGTGRFESSRWLTLNPQEQALIQAAASSGQSLLGEQTVLPLKVGSRVVGVALVDSSFQNGDLHLLELFAAQAAVAMENARLYELATVDDLTGLANKRAWLARLEETVQLATRHDLPTSVLMLDVDHFKRINDTHGHLVGDRVLAALGQCVRGHLRRSDVAGRYGGEELVVLLPHTPPAGAHVIAERLRRSISELNFQVEQQAVPVRVSVGVASLPCPGPWDQSAALSEDVLARADRALYVAKQQGRDRVVQDQLTADAAPEWA